MKNIIVVAVVIVALVGSTFALDRDSNVCSLPHSQNGNGKMSCRAYIPSWSYNRKTNSCVKFVYGGCGGNKNRFGSQGECQRKCMKNSKKLVPK